MSETQTYKGKFVCTGLSVSEFIEEYESKYNFDYCEDCGIHENFNELVYNMCHVPDANYIDFFHHEDKVYQVVELDNLQYESFIELDEGTGKFITSYYDGSSDLSEMLSKGMGL